MKQVSWLFFIIILLAACARPAKKPADWEREAKIFVIKDLQRKLPLGKIYYAAHGAAAFINGVAIKILGYEAIYQKTENDGEIHVVLAQVKFSDGVKEDIVRIRYTLKQLGDALGLLFIYDFPSETYFLVADPLKDFVHDRKWIDEIKRRKVSLGMPEEAVLLSWGKPQAATITSSIKGEEKHFVYGRWTIFIHHGYVIGKKRLATQP